MIFYEAPHKLKQTIHDFYEAFGGERKIVLARELTKIHEEFLRLTLSEAMVYYEETVIKGEFVLLVEGNPEREEVKSERTIEELMQEALDSGMDKKEAMMKVAKEKGITKSEVYKYCLEHLQRGKEE